MNEEILKKVIEARELLEDRAIQNAVKIRAQLEDIDLKLKTAQENLSEYQLKRAAKESALFDKMKNKSIDAETLERYQLEIAKLRKDENEMSEAIISLENKQQSANRAMEVAKQSLIIASKAREKLDLYFDKYQAELDDKAEKIEEAEIEEIHQSKREMRSVYEA